MLTWYLDGDGDGFGDPTDAVTACSAPLGYVAASTDCDDADSGVNPSATEAHDQRDNDCDGQCDEGFISAGDLVVTEVMYDPDQTGDSLGEWFELYNTTSQDLAICGGWVLSDLGTESHAVNPPAPLVVPTHGYAVFGRSGDAGTNGGVTVDYQYSGFFLANGEDEIVVRFGATIVDQMAWDNGEFHWYTIDIAGHSIQLDRSSLDAVDNDDSYNWCSADTTFGVGDFGTPRAQNDSCPSTP